MTLQTSGAISLAQIATEFGGSAPHSLSEYYVSAVGLPSSGTISFNQFYGKSATLMIGSGNSSYMAAGEYTGEQRGLKDTSYSDILGATRYFPSSPFTMNSRSTELDSFLDGSSTFELLLVDKTGGASNSYANQPTNAGWSKVEVINNSTNAKKTFTRASATFVGAVGGYTGSSNLSAGRWTWSDSSRFLPTSANTTSFTLKIYA